MKFCQFSNPDSSHQSKNAAGVLQLSASKVQLINHKKILQERDFYTSLGASTVY